MLAREAAQIRRFAGTTHDLAALNWQLMRLVKTHGSLNEIFAADATPASFGSDAALRAFVRSVCDRESWTGGSDGIYFYDASGGQAEAWFFNPDGSSAELCGNGMRGLGRLILDLRGTDTEVIASGGSTYAVHRAPSTPEGVRQVRLELPRLSFPGGALPSPFADFTAVTVPNPHVIGMVTDYSEPDLIEAGKRADEVFAEGANVSFLQRLADDEVFVRTFERGAGLTPSCGSGVVASRAAYSKTTGLDPRERVVVRNAGGVAAASMRVTGDDWLPVLEGNATIVYRTEASPSGEQLAPISWDATENDAYASADAANTTLLKSSGIITAHP
jgi:diaminopimelate epimerase